MKCKPPCAYRLSPTGLSRLMETFEDRTERIDAAAMALDLLIANIDTEKSFCMDAACKDIKESRERMGAISGWRTSLPTVSGARLPS